MDAIWTENGMTEIIQNMNLCETLSLKVHRINSAMEQNRRSVLQLQSQCVAAGIGEGHRRVTENLPKAERKNFTGSIELTAPAAGRVCPVTESSDPTFSHGAKTGNTKLSGLYALPVQRQVAEHRAALSHKGNGHQGIDKVKACELYCGACDSPGRRFSFCSSSWQGNGEEADGGSRAGNRKPSESGAEEFYRKH